MPGQLIAALRDDRFNAVGAQPMSDAGHAIGFVRSQSAWSAQGAAFGTLQPNLVHEDFKAGGLVLLSRREMNRQGNALAVGENMQFGAKPASGAA